MSRPNTPSMSPRPGSTASSKPNATTNRLLADHCIRRIAADPSVVLGSFYDARTESVVDQLSLDNKIITKTSQSKEIECVAKRADTFDRDDVFRTIKMHEEPWLSSILNISPSQGVTGLSKYAFSKSSSTRYLYYYYSSEEQSISQLKNAVINTLPKVIPTVAATHVVSSIKFGVQAFIVLQLPSDGDDSLDCFLDNVAEKLTKNRFQMSTNDKSLLNRIIVTKVFSNIPTISTLSTLADICQKLMEIRLHTYCHCPLEFQLRTIKWFYPSYPMSKAQYIPLEPQTVRIIMQYLLTLSSPMQELKTSSDSEDKKIIEEHLKDQYSALQQRIEDVKQTHSNELERIRDLVIQVRSGIILQESIIEKLSIEFNESLKRNIDPLIECLEALRKKAKLIRKLDEHKIKYLNMQQYSIEENDDLDTIFRRLRKEGNTTYVFCSTDKIRDHNSSTWKEQCDKWMGKRENNLSSAFVYADFTYNTSYHLSKVKILKIKSTGSSDKQVESSYSTSPSVPETTDLAREQPVNPLAEIDSIDTKSTSPREKLPTNTNEKPKLPQSSAQPTSEVSNTFNDQSKETGRLIHSAFSPDESTAQTTTPKTEQEDDAKKRTDISPAPSAEKDKQIASSESTGQSPRLQNIASSDKATYHGGEQCDTPPLSIVPSPPITSRERRREARVEESSTSAITAESSSAKPSVSSEQLHRPDAHNSVPSVIPSVTSGVSESLKTQPREKGERPASATVITSSTSKLEQASKEQSKNIDERPGISSATGSTETKARSSRKNELVKVDEHTIQQSSSTRSTSAISIALNQQNGDSRESFDADKTSLPVKHSVSRHNSTNQTESLASSASQNISRQRRRSAKIEKESNASQSLNSSVTENTASSIDQTNKAHEPVDTSVSPSVAPSRPTLRTKIRSAGIDKSLESSSTEPSSSAENQRENIDERFDQSRVQELRHKEKSSLPQPEPHHSKMQAGSQTTHEPWAEQSERQQKSNSNSSRPPSVKYINILLLGESGIGKSTFINALINYQAFQTFEQACSNEPFLAMPVSFLITVGHHFEEKIVRFGGVDPNEDHDHPGQSVTQHCRSYILQIDPETKLRIIDTPGVGDTRGIDQDDLNMQHVLSFINNLSHLNAICILLKPNESRLNVLLRTYFTRLLNFLGENARHNIVFCFTNTRSTFFAPGNTGPLLKKMINSLPINDIPFEKRNTFCFDSESFRYLVILRNGIEFDSYQKEEYQKSWTASSTTSIRLIQYICKELKPYPQSKWQSVEHAHFQINQLIRPVLETTRNILRNITLLKQISSTLIINLRPVALSEPSLLCYAHPRTPQRFKDFWILPDQLHTLSDKCNAQDGHRRKHLDVSYKLEYELIEYSGEQFFQEMTSDLIQLRATIVEFGEFYGYVVDTLKQKDPMLSALKQIITEEGQICSEEARASLNSTLRDAFTTLREEYKERRNHSMSIHLPVDIPNVYEQIKTIRNINEIKEQVQAIKATQKKYVKQHEKQVSQV